MGLSKEQLAEMFPNGLDFSRFQIERVRERNELTQRLMNLNGMNTGGESYEAIYGSGRVAGEQGREYVLVKNDGVEGGWVLGVVGRKEGVVAPNRNPRQKHVDKVVPGENKSNPIILDSTQKGKRRGENDEEDEEDDEEFEDVPIEGLNRLPRLTSQRSVSTVGLDLEELERQQMQQAIYESQREQPGYRSQKPNANDGSLFITAGEDESMHDLDLDGLFSPSANAPNEDPINAIDQAMYDDDDAFQKAIALSMGEHEAEREVEDIDFARAVQLSKQEHTQKQIQAKGKQKAVTFHFSDEDSEDDMDLQAAMRASKASNTKPRASSSSNGESSRSGAVPNPFSGILPFEAMPFDFGNSLLGKKRKDTSSKNALGIDFYTSDESPKEGGFVKEDKEVAGTQKPKANEEEKPLPLPPWFAKTTDIRKEVQEQGKMVEEENALEPIIPTQSNKEKEYVVVSSDDEGEDSDVEMVDALPPKPVGGPQKKVEESFPKSPLKTADLIMGGLAETIRAVPPLDAVHDKGEYHNREKSVTGIEPHETAQQKGAMLDGELEAKLEAAGGEKFTSPTEQTDETKTVDSDEELEWEESGDEGKTKASGDAATQHTEERFPSHPTDDATLSTAEAEVEAAENEFSDTEYQELVSQLHAEAEEHARFASSLTSRDIISLNDPRPSKRTLTAEEYGLELNALRNQQRKDRRDADEVTHTMVSECQQLLKLFGLPYITAPMEAEAQCAELVRLGLVDGIVTDDSDCFLFGGTRVYKNMFNQAKYVECYLLGDLEKEFGLDRKKLISLAYLLGSDYTEGLSGVGPVTALELLTEFAESGESDESPVAPLQRFKSWWEEVQHLAGITYNDTQDSKFKKKFRKSHATKLSLPSRFPAPEVDHAYLKPEVDGDPSEFKWGVPDLDGLRHFLMVTVGWSQERCDEVLVPVVRDMNKRLAEGTQSNITRYFEGAVGAGAFAPRKREVGKSRRMDAVMHRLHRIASGKTGSGSQGENNECEGEGEGGGHAGQAAAVAMPISMKDAATSSLPSANKAKKTTGPKKASSGRKRQKKKAQTSPVSVSSSDNEDGPGQGGVLGESDSVVEVNGSGSSNSTISKKRRATTSRAGSTAAAATQSGRKPRRGSRTNRARCRGKSLTAAD